MSNRPSTYTAKDLNCPISLDQMTLPTKTPCDHTFEKKHIEEWITTHHNSTCPCCRGPIALDTLSPNLPMRNYIFQETPDKKEHIKRVLAAGEKHTDSETAFLNDPMHKQLKKEIETKQQRKVSIKQLETIDKKLYAANANIIMVASILVFTPSLTTGLVLGFQISMQSLPGGFLISLTIAISVTQIGFLVHGIITKTQATKEKQQLLSNNSLLTKADISDRPAPLIVCRSLE